jgi:hypothetical protein
MLTYQYLCAIITDTILKCENEDKETWLGGEERADDGRTIDGGLPDAGSGAAD